MLQEISSFKECLKLIEYHKKIEELLYDWKDKIPDKIVHSTDFDKNYKIRAVWFQLLLSYIEKGVKDGYLDKELDDATKKIIQGYKKLNEGDSKNKKEYKKIIEEANNILLNALNHISKIYILE
ncbi:MAG: hypothetical protein J7J93_02125 [Candidatus Aenigmarchaeota archaeon]|nr:hypothetical protein [Candidatus Aenigmarchaeota archaeon]